MALFQFGAGTEFWSLFAVYLIIQGLDGNLLVPVLFSEAVNLHPLVIILSVVIFGGLWGFWGVFFAIPLATLIKAVVHAPAGWPGGWTTTDVFGIKKTPGEDLPPPASCSASGVFFQPVQHHVVVIAGLEVIKDVFDFAIGIDEETNTVNTVVGFPHEGFFAPDAKLLANLMVFIRQQREVQQLFLGETGELFRFIGADAQHFYTGFLQVVHIIAQAARLDGAARGHGFRVKINQDTLSWKSVKFTSSPSWSVS